MVDFQERITQETEPAIRVEHDVRYAAIAPLVAAASAWVDLGCGVGLAARAALTRGRPAKLTIVDFDEDALREAARTLGDDVTAIVADLSAADGLQTLRGAIDDGAIVSCFETFEHLARFSPLLELLVELAESRGITVVLSVPNDAFSGVENPHHMTVWGEGAIEELRALLPKGYVLARQLALAGSVIAIGDAPRDHVLPVTAQSGGAVPTHYIAAFGAAAGELLGAAAVAQVDMTSQRAWERQRSADLAYLRVEARDRNELYEQVKQDNRERDEWRGYIHDLEVRLGLPTDDDRATSAADAGSTV